MVKPSNVETAEQKLAGAIEVGMVEPRYRAVAAPAARFNLVELQWKRLACLNR
jgi:hypothetical protein